MMNAAMRRAEKAIEKLSLGKVELRGSDDETTVFHLISLGSGFAVLGFFFDKDPLAALTVSLPFEVHAGNASAVSETVTALNAPMFWGFCGE